ncbi:hypothetical protein GEV33_005837 [Tenebrio molitor]|uniref:Uncharacterized protein n=1 Tax=Tenebrio molitor TaxID=7067 RepID=A0A8J6LC95_TENMO|nr:hypothetical protein GEV33_005837 [Tenebrio molitor]
MNLQLNDNYLFKARGHSTTNSKMRFAGASTALDEVSDFRIFNLGTALCDKACCACVVLRNQKCAFPVVLHVHVSRQVYRHGAGLFTSKFYQAGIFRFWTVKSRSKKKDRKKDGVEKKKMTFRQVTKEEKGPNIAVRSPIAEKRRRESESEV